MPKKGTRKIVVNGITYQYKIEGCRKERSVTILNPTNNNLFARDYDHVFTFTPKDIREIILKEKI